MEPSRSANTDILVSFLLPAAEERRLLERATEKGIDVSTYLRALVEADLNRPPRLSEVLAPIREEFRRSGMTEDELGALIEEAREEVWQGKHRGTPGG